MTFIRCPGNKSKHINKFIKYFPISYDRYIEPFLGSGAVFLHLQPSKWIINDTNNLLINLWQLIQNKPFVVSKFMESMKVLLKMTIQDKKDSLNLKLEEYKKTHSIRKKTLLYLLFKCCFYMGYFNTYVTTLDPSLVKNKIFCLTNRYQTNIDNISRFLNSTEGQIMNRDYKSILKLTKEGDFVFLDPPYHENKDYQFAYDPSQQLKDVSLTELQNQVKILDQKKVKWLMTQADTPEIREVFRDYDIHTFKVFRAASQSYKTELIIRNFK